MTIMYASRILLLATCLDVVVLGKPLYHHKRDGLSLYGNDAVLPASSSPALDIPEAPEETSDAVLYKSADALSDNSAYATEAISDAGSTVLEEAATSAALYEDLDAESTFVTEQVSAVSSSVEAEEIIPSTGLEDFTTESPYDQLGEEAATSIEPVQSSGEEYVVSTEQPTASESSGINAESTISDVRPEEQTSEALAGQGTAVSASSDSSPLLYEPAPTTFSTSTATASTGLLNGEGEGQGQEKEEQQVSFSVMSTLIDLSGKTTDPVPYSSATETSFVSAELPASELDEGSYYQTADTVLFDAEGLLTSSDIFAPSATDTAVDLQEDSYATLPASSSKVNIDAEASSEAALQLSSYLAGSVFSDTDATAVDATDASSYETAISTAALSTLDNEYSAGSIAASATAVSDSSSAGLESFGTETAASDDQGTETAISEGLESAASASSTAVSSVIESEGESFTELSAIIPSVLTSSAAAITYDFINGEPIATQDASVIKETTFVPGLITVPLSTAEEKTEEASSLPTFSTTADQQQGEDQGDQVPITSATPSSAQSSIEDEASSSFSDEGIFSSSLLAIPPEQPSSVIASAPASASAPESPSESPYLTIPAAPSTETLNPVSSSAAADGNQGVPVITGFPSPLPSSSQPVSLPSATSLPKEDYNQQDGDDNGVGSEKVTTIPLTISSVVVVTSTVAPTADFGGAGQGGQAPVQTDSQEQQQQQQQEKEKEKEKEQKKETQTQKEPQGVYTVTIVPPANRPEATAAPEQGPGNGSEENTNSGGGNDSENNDGKKDKNKDKDEGGRDGGGADDDDDQAQQGQQGQQGQQENQDDNNNNNNNNGKDDKDSGAGLVIEPIPESMIYTVTETVTVTQAGAGAAGAAGAAVATPTETVTVTACY